MNYTQLRRQITTIVQSHTLCHYEAIGAAGNIMEIPIIKASPHMYEALKKIAACESHSPGDVVDIARQALNEVEVDKMKFTPNQREKITEWLKDLAYNPVEYSVDQTVNEIEMLLGDNKEG